MVPQTPEVHLLSRNCVRRDEAKPGGPDQNMLRAWEQPMLAQVIPGLQRQEPKRRSCLTWEHLAFLRNACHQNVASRPNAAESHRVKG